MGAEEGGADVGQSRRSTDGLAKEAAASLRRGEGGVAKPPAAARAGREGAREARIVRRLEWRSSALNHHHSVVGRRWQADSC